MPACTFKIAGTPQQSDLLKINREDLYGETRTRVIDGNQKDLQKAALPQEGNCYLLRGQVRRATKVGDTFTLTPPMVVDVATGQPKEQAPSAFKFAPEFQPTTAEEAALFETHDVYAVPGLKLEPGSIFKGNFNYRAGFDRNDAILEINQDGTFLLVGVFKTPTWIGIESDSQLLIAEAEETATPEAETEFSSLF